MAKAKKKVVETTEDKLVVRETFKNEKKRGDLLWCKKCQCGLNGFPNEDRYKSGDFCPRCLNKYHHRIDKKQISGILMTIDEFLSERAKIAELNKIKREANRLRSVKGTNEIVSEAVEPLQRENQSLKQEIAKIKEMLKLNNSGSESSK